LLVTANAMLRDNRPWQDTTQKVVAAT
jgi:hypothetical protein